MRSLMDRALGGFLGLAIGDALGAQVEFKLPGTFTEVKEMTGGGVFNLRPGQVTDDTSMSVLSAISLIQCNRFDPIHTMQMFSQWSSSPACFDIGNTIQDAILAFEGTGNPYQGREDHHFSGKGSLMRIYPSILWTLGLEEKEAFKIVWDMTRLTHGSNIVYEISFHFFQMIRSIFHDDKITKEMLLRHLIIDEPKSTGFICDTFNVALWGFANSDSFEEGLLKVVNLGGDADTAGAVYGQLAGSFYGFKALPERFLKHIKEKEEIGELVTQLLTLTKSNL